MYTRKSHEEKMQGTVECQWIGCGHKWLPKYSTPARCPRCLRADWQIGKQETVIQETESGQEAEGSSIRVCHICGSMRSIHRVSCQYCNRPDVDYYAALTTTAYSKFVRFCLRYGGDDLTLLAYKKVMVEHPNKTLFQGIADKALLLPPRPQLTERKLLQDTTLERVNYRGPIPKVKDPVAWLQMREETLKDWIDNGEIGDEHGDEFIYETYLRQKPTEPEFQIQENAIRGRQEMHNIRVADGIPTIKMVDRHKATKEELERIDKYVPGKRR